ncbi:hypothetical protein C2I18_20115 [Paenibacillus sp. PK3_47]|uniref:glycosyl hydrolase n=1 Tax=Paenibacillus sp. PK3_47 TaxID=2072642 RepID=UPI00201DA880|nr:glycosyl hydrolase [Paenibacillus sp. PK3_47]UQZ35622.1 hypothetical protein C2I18_20115 [Paenibacillus sp. PK3_47]
MKTTTNVWSRLADPPVDYRPVPLWSWNDRLEREELERQIEEMHKAGIGGFFMHARGGLRTTYMGEEWMEAIRISIEHSRRLGMNAWFYDENGWPSGFADGRVPAKGLAFQQKRLAYEQAPFQSALEQGRVLGYYSVLENGKGWRLLPPGEEAAADLRVYYEVNPYYTDTLSTAAVQAFIAAAYESYWDQFGEQYGAELHGVFTDEPQFARGGLPWSFELEEVFTSRKGYNVLEMLPSLFFETGGCRKARYDYWETVTFMFTQAYARQIGEWCAGRGWSATGHVVDEQELMHQVTSVGDPMAFYEHLQIPGCDWLGRFTGSDPLVPKQVGSVARQLGKKQAITESFGCSGWNVSFADLRRIGEWQFVHGINLLCPHLQGYTLRGLRKRDYPPSLFYQQPWWADYKGFNDYFARLSMLLAEAEAVAEVLLIHPVRTAWTLQRGEDSSAIVPYHEAFAQLSKWLCQSLIEHDYGSESIIAGHGRVSGDRFRIGEASYRVVIVPPCLTLDRHTVQLLGEFAAGGGTLIACEPYPVLAGGEEDAGLAGLMQAAIHPQWSREAIGQAVSAVAAPFLRISDAEGMPLAADTLNVRTMELDGSFLYYVVNSGTEAYPLLQLELCRQGEVSLIDLETGNISPVGQEALLDGVLLQLPLYPGQSLMLKLDPFTAAAAEDGFTASTAEPQMPGEQGDMRSGIQDMEVLSYKKLGSTWEITRMDLNSLTLDHARLRVEGGEWSQLQPVIFMQEQLLAYGRPVAAELEFEFAVSFDISRQRELYLVLEQPEWLEIRLNGEPVSPETCGWWLDSSLQKIDIRGKAVSGRNTIMLKYDFRPSAELYSKLERAKAFEAEGNKLTMEQEIESIYLLGSFGVQSLDKFEAAERRSLWTTGPFTLTEVPESVQTGDLAAQGFPFFAGSIHLRQTVDIPADYMNDAAWTFQAPPDAIVSKLLINGNLVRTFLWEPYAADIAPYLRTGSNIIGLILTGSCRNLLGPHHHIKGEVYKIGPDSFKDKPGWTDKDLPPDTHVYQERYSFVRFGLASDPLIVRGQ